MHTTTMSTPTSTAADMDSLQPSWPWMKNAKCRLHNPIDLSDEFDKRPAVKDLLVKHRSEIDLMKTKLAGDPLYCVNKHDDLWVLRFLLSHKGHVHKALEAAHSTLAFRQEHNLDDQDIRGIQVTSSNLLSGSDDLPWYAAAAGKMLNCYEDEHTLIYTIPNVERGVVGYLQLAGRNQHKMATALQAKDYFQAHLFFTEWKFQWIDYLTRTTGRLTKYLSIADCQGAHQKMIHKESKKMDSQAAKTMEDKYPQLLGSMVVCHAPKWISVIFTLLKPFVPKRLLEKVDLLKPAHKKKDLHKLQEHLALEHLPERYGGTLEGWPPQSSLPIE